MSNSKLSPIPGSPNNPNKPARKTVTITAVEDDDDDALHHNNHHQEPTAHHSNSWNHHPHPQEDVIPGPPLERERSSGGKNNNNSGHKKEHSNGSSITSSSRRSGGGLMGMFSNLGNRSSHKTTTTTTQQPPQSPKQQQHDDILQLSLTDHRHWSGGGILASRTDLDLDPDVFAAGCNLLQAAARGDVHAIQGYLAVRPSHVNFRDYDRRTALHVAASEGHLNVCQLLVEQFHCRVNRSDRWGGSPLDDAHRHQHTAVAKYLRDKGATTGSGNKLTNLITAAAEGDLDEVQLLLQGHVQPKASTTAVLQADNQQDVSNSRSGQLALDLNKGDYDKRTALHLAAGEGHAEIVKVLLEKGADVNVVDRWERTPLDDATDGNYELCIKVLTENGGTRGKNRLSGRDENEGGNIHKDLADLDSSQKRTINNLRIDFEELQMIDRIGSGAFGEIYKCRWRGTLVAAKIIKTAKIRRDWVQKKAMQNIKDGGDVDDAIKEMDDAEMSETEKDMALQDFRQEISVVKSLRHPNICLMLAYSTTERYECLISELCKCSLLDVFKSHMVQGSRMPKRSQYVYAQQLAQGMAYLHTCNPPIIHRDLKPANLLIDHSGILKISDFGLSKVRPDPSQDEVDKFTMTGETGSYRFMAPEVFRHENYNETVDVYSFAMIFYYLLVGRPPWPTLSGQEAVRLASEEGDRPTIPRDLDSRSVGLLKDCWQDDSSARPSFQKILDFLHSYSKEVFHSDINIVAVAASPELAKQGCACTIL